MSLVGLQAAQAQEKFTYMTNWYAQAEHGGFYQAVATGIYKKYGLDTLRKIDEANVPLKDTIYDAVYDYIDMTELYEEYVEACGDMDLNWHNYYYGEVFRMFKNDGYATWGDNYGEN